VLAQGAEDSQCLAKALDGFGEALLVEADAAEAEDHIGFAVAVAESTVQGARRVKQLNCLDAALACDEGVCEPPGGLCLPAEVSHRAIDRESLFVAGCRGGDASVHRFGEADAQEDHRTRRHVVLAVVELSQQIAKQLLLLRTSRRRHRPVDLARGVARARQRVVRLRRESIEPRASGPQVRCGACEEDDREVRHPEHDRDPHAPPEQVTPEVQSGAGTPPAVHRIEILEPMHEDRVGSVARGCAYRGHHVLMTGLAERDIGDLKIGHVLAHLLDESSTELRVVGHGERQPKAIGASQHALHGRELSTVLGRRGHAGGHAHSTISCSIGLTPYQSPSGPR
jgi:hypothetical protein